MQIRIIAAGSSKWERLFRRWGLSLLIGEEALFDTFGDPGVILNNLRKFNVETEKIKKIVLSHDDWDHISGLWYLLNIRKDVTVYICPGFRRDIKERVVSFGVKVIDVREGTRINDDIYSTGELYGESDGRKIYEQSAIIKSANGSAIICGCAHPGIVNIVRYVKERFQMNAHTLIGGFHLKNNTSEMNEHTIKKLQELSVRRIAPMHCTGRRATEAMQLAFGQNFIKAQEGEVIEI
ncbi:MAG: MBL fold metallo-hydrolase [Candidatus Omnitrophica bacterium]|nr:MBL fold metallo-hydrolase [Candidatus Omnitrophota bacterium]MDD5552572.1 MBL fold metallo-hydrolase [Candidatus Omnitrophota bacterium]